MNICLDDRCVLCFLQRTASPSGVIGRLQTRQINVEVVLSGTHTHTRGFLIPPACTFVITVITSECIRFYQPRRGSRRLRTSSYTLVYCATHIVVPHVMFTSYKQQVQPQINVVLRSSRQQTDDMHLSFYVSGKNLK